MSKKKPAETEAESAEQVKLTIAYEHIATPHSIELRKNGGKLFIEAQMNDHAHRQVIGATTVENILLASGLQFPTATTDIEMLFSPHNGDIVSATPVPNGKELAEETPADDPPDEEQTEE